MAYEDTIRLYRGNKSGLPTVLDGEPVWAHDTGELYVGGRYGNVRIGYGITPEAYGAKGDGTTDDTVAIQAAIDAADDNHGVVLLGPKNYLISDTLTITNRITIRGSGFGNPVTAAERYGTRITKSVDAIGIQVKSGANATVLEGFTLYAALTGDTTDGIVIGETDATNGAGSCVLRDLWVQGMGGKGINVTNGNGGQMYNIVANANGSHGVYLHSTHTSADNVNAWLLCGITTLSNGGDGLNLDTAVSNTVIGLDAEGNTERGLYVARPYNFIRGYCESNDSDDASGYQFVTGAGAFDCVFFLRLLKRTSQTTSYSIGNNACMLYIQDGSGTSPAFLYNGQAAFRAADGTAPLIITSTTLVDNLNSDMWDGYEFADFLNQAVRDSDSPTFETIAPTGVTAGAIPYRSAQTEHVTNGDFETWTTETNAGTWVESVGGTGTITRTTEKHAGTYGVEFVEDAGGTRSYQYQAITLTAGDPYVLSAWYKNEAAKQVAIVVEDSTSTVYLQSDGTWSTSWARIVLPSSTSWAEYSRGFVAHASYTAYNIYIGNIAESCTSYFDDVSIKDAGVLADSPLSTDGTDIDNSGVYKVDGTQVVGNRVVDARLANTPNSGDADTDNLIDALRDLIISHGLGASS
jgi:hypothetical protein